MRISSSTRRLPELRFYVQVDDRARWQVPQYGWQRMRAPDCSGCTISETTSTGYMEYPNSYFFVAAPDVPHFRVQVDQLDGSTVVNSGVVDVRVVGEKLAGVPRGSNSTESGRWWLVPADMRVRYPTSSIHSPMPASVAARLRYIAGHASEQARDNVFIKVGDSMTVSGAFLGGASDPVVTRSCWQDGTLLTPSTYEVKLPNDADLIPTLRHFRSGIVTADNYEGNAETSSVAWPPLHRCPGGCGGAMGDRRRSRCSAVPRNGGHAAAVCVDRLRGERSRARRWSDDGLQRQGTELSSQFLRARRQRGGAGHRPNSSHDSTASRLKRPVSVGRTYFQCVDSGEGAQSASSTGRLLSGARHGAKPQAARQSQRASDGRVGHRWRRFASDCR